MTNTTETVNGLTFVDYLKLVSVLLPRRAIYLLDETRVKWFYNNKFTTNDCATRLRVEILDEYNSRD